MLCKYLWDIFRCQHSDWVPNEGDTVSVTDTLSDERSERVKQCCGNTEEGVGKVREASEEVTCERLVSGEANGWGGKERGSCRGNCMYKGLEAKHCRPIINVYLSMEKKPNHV